MTYLVALLILIFATITAAAASWWCGRWLPIGTRQRHHEIGSAVFLQVGTLVAVLLAFVFSSVWDEYKTAAEAINGECGALHGAVMMANALPEGEGKPVIRAVAEYTHDVVQFEWPSMSARQRSEKAAAALQQVIDSAVRGDVARPSDAATKAQILGLLANAHADRETRLFQMTQGVPAVMWAVLIGISCLLVLFIALSGLEEPGRSLFAAIFASAITMVLLLLQMLDFPFEGALALPPADFIKLLGQCMALLQAR
jgi:uncharacterized protein YbaA (DUF1428 family)